MAQTISTFLIGFSSAFFTIFAVHILLFRRARTRLQTIIGIIMAVWAAWNLKDIATMLPGMYRQEVLDWVMIIDGWSALTYAVLVFETTSPGWTTLRRLTWLSLPFAAFTIAYVVRPSQEVLYAYVAFLWFFAWSVVIIAWVGMRRYLRHLHANYSYLEGIDVSWLGPVLGFAIVSQLSWLATSLVNNVWADVIYYATTLLLWLMVLYYTWDFTPLPHPDDADNDVAEVSSTLPPTAIAAEDEQSIPTSAAREFAFAGELENIIIEKQLYLLKDLTLADLAAAVDSNRTYVSNYISQNLGTTFYDYINRLRIQRGSLPIMKEHPDYKLEYVAAESGFSSISTFRRAFVRVTGQTPSQFAASAEATSK